jgi:hypothetical protein
MPKRKSQERVLLMKRDFEVMSSLYENKVLTKKQIKRYFFNKGADSTVNRRLRKLTGISLIKKSFIDTDKKTIQVFSLTEKGLTKVRPYLSYEIKGKSYRSDSKLHDCTLVYIRKRFEEMAMTKSYYTENVLQSSLDYKEDKYLLPFIKLNSDALVQLETKLGTVNLAVEYEASLKSYRRYKKKFDEYYSSRDIEGVLYICSKKCILETLKKVDRDVSKRHQCEPKMYFTLLENILEPKEEVVFRNIDQFIFKVS